jgi:Na+-driven multidrug efflux pump
MLIGIGYRAHSLKLGQQRRDERKDPGTAFVMTIILGVGISALFLIFLDPILNFRRRRRIRYAKQFSTGSCRATFVYLMV